MLIRRLGAPGRHVYGGQGTAAQLRLLSSQGIHGVGEGQPGVG